MKVSTERSDVTQAALRRGTRQSRGERGHLNEMDYQIPDHIQTAYREPQADVDYRANPSAGGTEMTRECPTYDQPIPRPEAPARPQLNRQTVADSMLQTPLETGYSPDLPACLSFERGESGAPKPYPEEPDSLTIQGPC